MADITSKTKYEYHMDVDGDDLADANGAIDRCFQSFAYSMTRITAEVGKNSGVILFVHKGSPYGSITIDALNFNLIAFGTAQDNLPAFDIVTISNASSSVRIVGITANQFIITGAGSVYFENCTCLASITKSGSGYVSASSNCNFQTASFSVTGTGLILLQGSLLGSVTVNNAAAYLSIKNCPSVGVVTLTAGAMIINDSVPTSATSTGNSIITSSGTVLYFFNSQPSTSVQTVGRVSIAGFYSIGGVLYDVANSTITGTCLNKKYGFDNIKLAASAVPTVTGKTKGLVLDSDGSFAEQVLPSGGGASFPTSAQGQLYDDGSGNRSWERGIYVVYDQTLAYKTGQIVENSGLFYKANGAITANTSFVIDNTGTSGATWKLVGTSSSGIPSTNYIAVATFGSDSTGNGTEVNPYSTVQNGINGATVNNATVYLAPGSYGTCTVNNKNTLTITSARGIALNNNTVTVGQVTTTGFTIGLSLRNIAIQTSGTTVPLVISDSGLNHGFENVVFKPNGTTTPIQFSASSFSTLANGTYSLVFRNCDFGGNNMVGANIPGTVSINIYLYNCKNFRMNALLDRWSIYHMNCENFIYPIAYSSGSVCKILGDENFNKAGNIAGVDYNTGYLPRAIIENNPILPHYTKNRVLNGSFTVNTMNTAAEYGTSASAGAYVCDYWQYIGLDSGGMLASAFDIGSNGYKHIRVRPNSTFASGTNKMKLVQRIFSADTVGIANNYVSFQMKHMYGTTLAPSAIKVTFYAPNTKDGFLQPHEWTIANRSSSYSQLAQLVITPQTTSNVEITYKGEGFLLATAGSVNTDNGLEIEIEITHNPTNNQATYYFRDIMLEVGMTCSAYVENKNRRTITNTIPFHWSSEAQGDPTNNTVSGLPFSGAIAGNAFLQGSGSGSSWRNYGIQLTQGSSQSGLLWLNIRNIDWCRSFRISSYGEVNTDGDTLYIGLAGSTQADYVTNKHNSTINSLIAVWNVYNVTRETRFTYNGNVVGNTGNLSYANNGKNEVHLTVVNTVNNKKYMYLSLNGLDRVVGSLDMTATGFRAAGDIFSYGFWTGAAGVNSNIKYLKFEYLD